MLKSLTKLSIPQTLIAIAMPKAMAATMSNVFTALTIPTSILLSSISLTKFISGTPGIINNAQAISGCQGVLEWRIGTSQVGIVASMAGVEIKAESHANSVEKNAANAILA